MVELLRYYVMPCGRATRCQSRTAHSLALLKISLKYGQQTSAPRPSDTVSASAPNIPLKKITSFHKQHAILDPKVTCDKAHISLHVKKQYQLSKIKVYTRNQIKTTFQTAFLNASSAARR